MNAGMLGRMLLFIGVALAVIGLLMMLGERLPLRLGRLPGDMVIRGRNSVLYIPITTSILISVILSLVLWLIRR
jgi:hypothetical protein